MGLVAKVGLVCIVLAGCGAQEAARTSATPPSAGHAEANSRYFEGGTPTIQQPVFEKDGELEDGAVAGLDDSTVAAQDEAGTPAPAAAEAPPADRPAPPVAGRPQAPANDGNGPVPPKPSRRIIYVASLDLVVEDFAATEKTIPELIRKFDGYVSENHVSSRSGSQRGGRWVARIPVDRYEAFLAALGDLGVPENIQQNAQDVTQEFIDLEARMANQRRLEDRILKLLEKNDGGIKDVIEVERELARVRSDIETMEGRLRYLRNQVSLTTVTVNVREQQNYTPPQAPTFAGKIGRTWEESLRGLGIFGQGLVLVGVALAPWVAVSLPFLGGAVWYWRRSRRAVDV